MTSGINSSKIIDVNPSIGIRSFRSKYKKLFRSDPEICLLGSFFYQTKGRKNSLFLERKGCGTK